MAISQSIPQSDRIKDRSQTPKQWCWDVDAMYSSWELWEQEFKSVGNESQSPRWPQIEELRKKWSQTPETFKQLIEFCLSLERNLSKLYTYAHLRHDEDVASEIPKQAYSRITSLLHDFSQETSWIQPAVLDLPDEQMAQFLKSPVLKDYVFHIEKTLRMKAHTLPEAEEELMARAGKALQTASQAFSAFNNADLKFSPVIDGKGNEREMTHGKYLLYLRDNDRVLREGAFKSMHRSFLAFENTICELLNGQIQSHLFDAKARKFNSCLEAALFPNQVDLKVYKALIEAVRSQLPAVHRYISLRKKALQLDRVHAYDLHLSLVKQVEMGMPYDEAVEAIIASLEPMGDAYREVLKKGLTDDRWVDRYENERKRSGAYSSGCYDSMPYILMNYQGILNDVMTLTHEAGHSMHSYLSRQGQPFHYSQYSIFVAEVASTFHEELLSRYLLSQAKTNEEKAYLINQKIDDMRGTLVRQTLFAEFELKLHTFAEQGIPITPALLNQEYRQLNAEYYGPDFYLDEELDIEWARIPHFYYNFYVYQYATGISAAHALVEKVLREGPAARDDYMAFLSAGSSRYPLDVLKGAGVDMRSSEPVVSAMKRFGELVNTLEDLLLKKS